MTVIITYFALNFINFLATSLLYKIYRPKYDQNFLIVLCSGLINGDQISPLLASRIDKALSFYNEAKITGFEMKIIFSSGKGKDETISEAKAMSLYAINRGLPETDVILEDKSKTTLQNMKFSKKFIPKGAKVLFFTNNFHVFRAAIFAKKAKLNAQGIGSKTAKYFLPNAVIREFIAIIMLYKRPHIFVVGSITLIYLLGLILSYGHLLFS